jgi:hypothetical protein
MDYAEAGLRLRLDKPLYDQLHEGHARPAREHLYAGLDYRSKLDRFMKNHDEPGRRGRFRNVRFPSSCVSAMSIAPPGGAARLRADMLAPIAR